MTLFFRVGNLIRNNTNKVNRVYDNKAGYTATPVASRWAGDPPPKKTKKVKCDGPTDRRTDRPTDGPTKRVVESRSTRLKRRRKFRLCESIGHWPLRGHCQKTKV